MSAHQEKPDSISPYSPAILARLNTLASHGEEVHIDVTNPPNALPVNVPDGVLSEGANFESGFLDGSQDGGVNGPPEEEHYKNQKETATEVTFIRDLGGLCLN